MSEGSTGEREAVGSVPAGGVRARAAAVLRTPPAAVGLFLFLLVLSALHLWWLLRFRRGFPVDIDEAGYLWFSFQLHDDLRDDGLLGLWRGFQSEGWVAPLLPVVTALVQLVGGAREVIASIGVQLLFLGVLVFASYGIGRRLLDRRAGVLTAVAVATTPAIADFVRTYHLVIPSAAMYTLAGFALIASDRLRRPLWVIAWGVALGLTLISRTMMVAFAPALIGAAVWMVAVDRAGRRRLVNLGLGLLAFGATALVWYASSWRLIFDYLLRAGYGDESASYGPGLSILSTEYWTHELTGAVNGSLYVPLAAILLLGLFLGLAGAVSRLTAEPGEVPRISSLVRRAAHSDVVVPAFVVLEGYAALTSSRNDGTGFVVPLLPSFIALAVYAALSAPWRAAQIAFAAALTLVASFNVVMKQDLVTSLSKVRVVQLPVFGPATLMDGRGYLHQHLARAARHPLGRPTHWLPEHDKRWPAVYDAVAGVVQPMAGRHVRVLLAAPEPLLNTSALRLAAYRARRDAIEFAYLEAPAGESPASYRGVLRNERSSVVLTTSEEGPQFGPSVTQRDVEAALESLGFGRVARFRLPDGRELRAWRCCPE